MFFSLDMSDLSSIYQVDYSKQSIIQRETNFQGRDYLIEEENSTSVSAE